MSVVDQSIVVFGLVFPRVAQKHRLQMLAHFADHLRSSAAAGGKNKSSAAAAAGSGGAGGAGGMPVTHADAVQMNIFTAVLSSLKSLVEAKAKLGGEDVKTAAVNLILGRNHIISPMFG